MKKLKISNVPIYRELESLYVWLADFTARSPKTQAWEVLGVELHSDIFHTLRIAEVALKSEDADKKLECMGLIADHIDDIKAIFRLFCRMSEARLPHVVTPKQEAEFYERMIKVDNNLYNWKRSYGSKHNIPSS